MKQIRIILNGKGAANPQVRAAIERIRGEGQPLEVSKFELPGKAETPLVSPVKLWTKVSRSWWPAAATAPSTRSPTAF